MNILICGAGAIGSNLTAILASDLKGQHKITVLDKDTVEERNIAPGTQLYTRDQIGTPKVDALQFNIYKWHQREIVVDHHELVNGDVLLNYDLIIDCFDNHISRELLQGAYNTGAHLNINPNNKTYELLHIGFSDNFTFSIEWADNYTTPSDITTGFDICEMQGAAAFVKSVSSVGALVAEEYILNNKKLEIVGGKFTHTLIQ